MEREYTLDKEESSRACEPPAQYGTVEGRKLRVVSDEELARCMTLEESERLISEKIYRYYHPVRQGWPNHDYYKGRCS